MKCPVCDKEHDDLCCPQCGFDASLNYEAHPSLGPVEHLPSLAAKRRAWQIRQQPVPQGDEEDAFEAGRFFYAPNMEESQRRQSMELQEAYALISDLQRDLDAARRCIDTLQNDLKTVTHYVYPENQKLKERILSLDQSNKALVKENSQIPELRKKYQLAAMRIEELQKELKAITESNHTENQKLTERIATLEQSNKALIRESYQMEDTVSSLTSQISKTEKELDDERGKLSAEKKKRETANRKCQSAEKERNSLREENETLTLQNAVLTAKLKQYQKNGFFSRLFSR